MAIGSVGTANGMANGFEEGWRQGVGLGHGVPLFGCNECNARIHRSACLEHAKSSPGKGLSGPISRDTAILSLRYPMSRDTFSGRLALPRNGAIPPLGYLVSHRHICAIPHFATYRAIVVRYPHKNKHERVLRYYRCKYRAI